MKRPIVVAGIVALVAVLITEIALAIWLPLSREDCVEEGLTYLFPEKNLIPTVTSDGAKMTSDYSGHFSKAAVTTDIGVCASLGKDILLKGGNAVDATIAATLCGGVTNMMSCGIGGGSFMLVHDEKSNLKKFINCRETAPVSADENMFNDSIEDSLRGGRAIAVPGEMKCFTHAHDKYGKLEWSELVQPVIDIIRDGVYMTAQMEYWMSEDQFDTLEGVPDFMSNPDGRRKKKGDKVYNENLALTFEKIRDDKNAFHTSLAKDIVDEINGFGGNFTVEDITSYEVQETDLMEFEFDEYIGLVPSAPASGPILAFIINMMSIFKERGQLPMDNGVDFQHKILETFKFAYGKRSLLGDPAFQENPEEYAELLANLTTREYASHFVDKVKDNTVLEFEEYEPAFEILENHGTSHLNVVDGNGMACALTSTVNTILGSKCIGAKTGIIYNNEMNDFSVPGHPNDFGVPPSPQNYIAPGKRPFSSMVPAIITDKNGKLVMTAGGSGGTRITTATATVIVKTLLQGMGLNEAVQDSRLHHQLMPDEIRTEERFNDDILAELEKKGQIRGPLKPNNAVVQAIFVNDTWLEGVSDSRKDGRPYGY